MQLVGVDDEATSDFFSSAWAAFEPEGTFPKMPLLLVAHALGSHLPFFDQIEKVFGKVILLPKSTSQDLEVVREVQSKENWEVADFTDVDIAYASGQGIRIAQKLGLSGGEPLSIIDVGGKYANGDATALRELAASHPIHIVEGTENGYQKYEMLLSNFVEEGFPHAANVRVWSVARSRLKDPEDSLTGRGIAEATETIVRMNYSLLGDRPATVFGYGKIGRSIAMALREKRLLVGVVEIDPLRQIDAQCDGFKLRTELEAQRLGGFVFLATGSATKDKGLDVSLLLGMRRDALVTFVTSFEDELKGSKEYFGPGKLEPIFEVRSSGLLPAVSDPATGGRSVSRIRGFSPKVLHRLPTAQANVVIINQGSPPNFLFEASCGPYIYLVFSGMLAALSRSYRGEGKTVGMNVLASADETKIAEAWHLSFKDDCPDEGFTPIIGGILESEPKV